MSIFQPIHFLLLYTLIMLMIPPNSTFNLKTFVKILTRLPRKVGQFFGLKESCSSQWIKTDTNALKKNLKDEMFGQPIAQTELPEILRKHWGERWTSNNLFICFFGSPGTGKTFATKLLNNYIFKQGDKSYYYLFYSGAEAFLNKRNLKILKDNMIESIEDAINECPFSVIVFDEADKYPHGFLDEVVLPFVEIPSGPNSKIFYKATFFFLTNVGSTKLMEKSLEIDSSYFQSHTLAKYNPIIDSLISESKDAFYSSHLVKGGIVKTFIPFLPHKEESFMQCLGKSLLSFNIHPEGTYAAIIKKNILQDIFLIPESNPMYISSGCKRLESLIFMQMSNQKRQKSVTHEEF